MIFNLFKSKPTLKNLIPEGFVDIHSHILPGIDDGAKNIQDSIKLIKKMKNLGFSKIIGTPHTYNGIYDNTNDTISKSYQSLSNKLNINLNITYASEYMIDNSLIERVKKKTILTLKDNYVLVEMSYLAPPINLYEIIYEIKVNGYIPIMAHPERYLFIDSLKEFFKLKKYGCLFQANLLSTTDFYGVNVRKNLDRLLKNGAIDFVGSDIHHTKHIEAFESKIKCEEILALKKAIENNSQFE